jgi:hypothetical protein
MKHQLLKMSNNQKAINAKLINTLPNELQNKVFLYVGPSVTNLPNSQEIADAVGARQERIDYGDMPPLIEPISAEMQHSLSVAIEANLTIDELMEDPEFADDVEQMEGFTLDNIIYLSQIISWGNTGINLSEAFEAEVELEN